MNMWTNGADELFTSEIDGKAKSWMNGSMAMSGNDEKVPNSLTSQEPNVICHDKNHETVSKEQEGRNVQRLVDDAVARNVEQHSQRCGKVDGNENGQTKGCIKEHGGAIMHEPGGRAVHGLGNWVS